jgi:hypothetical protein
MFGDYPTEGWRFRGFMAGVVALGLAGLLLMLAVAGD